MDFGRPLVRIESVASRSNIRYTPLPPPPANSKKDDEDDNESLDRAVIHASNLAARDIFLNTGGGTADSPTEEQEETTMAWQLDAASQFPERLTPEHNTIQEGDLVVMVISFDNLDFVYAKRKEIYGNRNGHFHHDDFIGLPFGSKVRSRDLQGYGYCYVLKPTPELWTRSLNHRTQVVHELDQSQILWQLHLTANMTVVESGTGSAALSHALLRTIAPHGHLHTYEFNEYRSQTANEEFQQHGLSHLVTVHHKDVCRRCTAITTNTTSTPTTTTDGATAESQQQQQQPGFDLPGQSVDAVILDLPEPWYAVPHAAFCLKHSTGRIASYSPCVEQTQKTIQALEACGFHSIKTFEYRQQEHYVDEFTLEPPPSKPRKKPTAHDLQSYQEQQAPEPQNNDDKATSVDEKEEEEEYNNEENAGDSTAGCDDDNDDDGNGKKEETATAAAADGTNNNNNNTKKRKLLVARPFVMMRGHTAFLTFATAGILPQPDPNAASTTATTTCNSQESS